MWLDHSGWTIMPGLKRYSLCLYQSGCCSSGHFSYSGLFWPLAPVEFSWGLTNMSLYLALVASLEKISKRNKLTKLISWSTALRGVYNKVFISPCYWQREKQKNRLIGHEWEKMYRSEQLNQNCFITIVSGNKFTK